MTERLFVYGTLAPGRQNEHMLRGVAGVWRPALVRGRLFEHGWGAGLGFPGIVLDDAGPEVHGLVFSSQQLGEHWQRLDDFEGEGYARVLTTAYLDDGEAVSAHVYVLRALPEGARPGPGQIS